MISNLLYVSVRKDNCTDEEIDKILDSARRNNKGLDITGVLLYTKSRFVQYLEGEYNEIVGLYDKIKEDDRHKNVILVAMSKTEKRLFPSWEMGAKNVGKDGVDFKTSLSSEDQKLFNDLIDGKTEDSNRAIQMIQKVLK